MESRPTETDGLILDLAAALGRGGSGLAFIGSALRQVAEARRLRHAHLVLDDEALGLQLFSPDGLPFPPDAPVKPAAVLARGPGLHAEPAAAVTEQEAAAIAALCHNALRVERLQYESVHDALTELYNRRGFDEHLAAAISRCERHGFPFALVLLDLDGFKAINDRWGHQGGDAVLRDVGQRIRRGLRAGDVAARVGGDEFALLLNVDSATAAQAVLERLAGTVGSGASDGVTWAAGIATCPEEATGTDALYGIADRRAYDDKSRRGERRRGR